jgi:hypothetical protein
MEAEVGVIVLLKLVGNDIHRAESMRQRNNLIQLENPAPPTNIHRTLRLKTNNLEAEPQQILETS